MKSIKNNLRYILTALLLSVGCLALAPVNANPIRFVTLGAMQVPLLQGKFYVDEFYQRVLVATQDGLGRLADAFEGWVVRGFLVRGSGVVARSAGQGLRLVQCGQVQFYAAVFILGAIGAIGWLLWKAAA